MGGDALGAVTASVGSAIAGTGAEDSSLIKASGAWSESVTGPARTPLHVDVTVEYPVARGVPRIVCMAFFFVIACLVV